MLQNLWPKIAGQPFRVAIAENLEEKLHGLISPLLLIYIFFQPFNHFAGVRNAAFYSMLLIFLLKLARKGIKPAPDRINQGQASKGFNQRIDWKDSTVIALFLLLAVIVISIILSQYKGDSLNAFRKNFFCQMVVFFVILTEFGSREKLQSLLYAVILSFVTVTVIIFIKNPPANLLNILEVKSNRETFLSGYALNAAFYIPFTIGYLLSIRERGLVKGFFWAFVLAEFVLVWLYYSSRTTLIAILTSAIIMILLSKRYKMFAVILLVLFAAGGISYVKKPELFERHTTLLSPGTYMNNVGLSGRGYIWRGTVDMIKASPVIGHGYGWKKIATVAREEGYLERWKEKWPETYDYFRRAGYGSANPHNLVLQILFEVGIAGLMAFILFWVTVFIKVVKIIKQGSRVRGQGSEHELRCFVKYGVVGVLISYFLINITNGLWEESYGVLTFTLAAITLVIYEHDRYEHH